MRCFISRAALLVKVTARICEGKARPVARMWAMRVVSTRVLPVPAPASTRTGPSVVSTASRCSGFSPFEIVRRAVVAAAGGHGARGDAAALRARARGRARGVRRRRACRLESRTSHPNVVIRDRKARSVRILCRHSRGCKQQRIASCLRWRRPGSG